MQQRNQIGAFAKPSVPSQALALLERSKYRFRIKIDTFGQLALSEKEKQIMGQRKRYGWIMWLL